MTAPTVDETLVEKARELVRTHRQIPSRNALKAGLKVGAEKAGAVRAQLLAEAKERGEDRRRALKRVSVGSTQTRRNRLSRTGPGSVLPVPVSPIVGPLAPRVEPQASPAPVISEPTSPEPVEGGPETKPASAARWPVLLLALPAFVAIWAGWVDMGRLTGFGVVHPLPGIWDRAQLDTAITLPIGLETYAAYALWIWLSGRVGGEARQFAKRSAIGALVLGGLGQVAYHLMIAAGMTQAPWWITTVVACLPVAVLGMGAALAHLVGREN